MSESTLVAKINADAAATVAEIKTEAATAVAVIERETDAIVAALRVEYELALRKRLAHLELVAISKAKQEANIALQQTKRDEVDKLFASVVADYINQPAQSYVTFFESYASTLVPNNLAGAIVRAPEKRLTETKEILAKLAIFGEVVASPRIDAGFIVEAADGVYDITLARLISERRSELEIRVIEKLNA